MPRHAHRRGEARLQRPAALNVQSVENPSAVRRPPHRVQQESARSEAEHGRRWTVGLSLRAAAIGGREQKRPAANLCEPLPGWRPGGLIAPTGRGRSQPHGNAAARRAFDEFPPALAQPLVRDPFAVRRPGGTEKRKQRPSKPPPSASRPPHRGKTRLADRTTSEIHAFRRIGSSSPIVPIYRGR